MTNEITPNARAPFVQSSGALSTYGVNTLLQMARALDSINGVGQKLELNSDFETVDNCFLNCKSQLTVTLNTNPKDNEKVIVFKNFTGDSVTVNDGVNSDVLTDNRGVLSYRYIAEFNEWFAGI